KDMYSFESSKWYYNNGNPRTIIYYDSNKDTMFYLSGRKNGTVNFKSIRSNNTYQNTSYNKKGELIKKITKENNNDSLRKETFKNGELIETEFMSLKQKSRSYLSKYDTVKYYQGQVGRWSGIVIID